MHGSLATNLGLLHAVRDGAKGSADVAVCVPYPYLAQARAVLDGSKVAWGAQDVSEHAQGAWTGEVSGAMLVDFGCRYALVGHSERRSFFGDTDAVVAAKFAAAQKVGLTPVLCVGESHHRLRLVLAAWKRAAMKVPSSARVARLLAERVPAKRVVAVEVHAIKGVLTAVAIRVACVLAAAAP